MTARPCQRIRVPYALQLLFACLALLATSSERAHARSPALDASITRGVAWLKTKHSDSKASSSAGEDSLAAYAMIKGGEPKDSPVVARIIQRVRAKASNGAYRPEGGQKGVYEAAADLMALEAADPIAYRPEIEAIAGFIIKEQRQGGYWDYVGMDRKGDTSVTQFAVLGLWAADRAKVEVPSAVWNAVARWLISTQYADGGFSYTPHNKGIGGDLGQTHSTTGAAVSALIIARMTLHPNAKNGAERGRDERPRFGVLKKVDVDSEQQTDAEKQATAAANVKPVAFSNLNGSVQRGMGWLAARITTVDHRWPIYYLYGLERVGALANVERIGGRDWFADGAAHLLKIQRDDGSWKGGEHGSENAATCFAVLFLTRSTAGILGREPGDIDGGLLAGGRGLPEDLSDVVTTDDGKIAARKVSGPLDELLTELEKVQTINVAAVQQEIVGKVQLDREELLKPESRERLLKLANHPHPEVRKTAVWALGRTGEIDVVKIAFKALEQDPDYDVAVEAHNALCWISRRPQGVPLPEGIEGPPSHGLPEDASKDERLKRIQAWREAATAAWKEWYLQVRPYEQRDDLAEVKEK